MVNIKNTLYYIAVFESRNHAIYLYQHIKRNGIHEYELVSTPCQIKSGCSYSLKFKNLEDYKLVQEEAQKIKCKILSVYSVEKLKGKRILKKLAI
ncbi:DUF3343 domain-containing protein [Alkaliphilus pronyensis]|uniref:DUF3343 domain-containing protein n=1 Tax=Alkaliphilus pronyensis TaxID=1482732 RepID=UPI0018658694|nr:DUF3343 domain-containing protein [Alkaliphilus pronyensis]